MAKKKDELNWQLPAPKQLLDKVEEIGKKEGRTRNAQAIWFLREGVNMYNNEYEPIKKENIMSERRMYQIENGEERVKWSDEDREIKRDFWGMLRAENLGSKLEGLRVGVLRSLSNDTCLVVTNGKGYGDIALEPALIDEATGEITIKSKGA